MVRVAPFLTHGVDRQNRPTGVTCVRDQETKKTKKETMAIRPDHLCHQIEIKFCMGQSSGVVVSIKFHHNRG